MTNAFIFWIDTSGIEGDDAVSKLHSECKIKSFCLKLWVAPTVDMIHLWPILSINTLPGIS